jgi:hypothetical protein
MDSGGQEGQDVAFSSKEGIYAPQLQITRGQDIQLPGDGNNDGKVDGQDFIIWLTHYGQNVSGASNGDFDDNGKIDIADYVI